MMKTRQRALKMLESKKAEVARLTKALAAADTDLQHAAFAKLKNMAGPAFGVDIKDDAAFRDLTNEMESAFGVDSGDVFEVVVQHLHHNEDATAETLQARLEECCGRAAGALKAHEGLIEKLVGIGAGTIDAACREYAVFANEVQSVLGLDLGHAVAQIKQHLDNDSPTPETLQAHFEQHGDHEAGALKPHEELIKELFAFAASFPVAGGGQGGEDGGEVDQAGERGPEEEDAMDDSGEVDQAGERSPEEEDAMDDSGEVDQAGERGPEEEDAMDDSGEVDQAGERGPEEEDAMDDSGEVGGAMEEDGGTDVSQMADGLALLGRGGGELDAGLGWGIGNPSGWGPSAPDHSDRAPPPPPPPPPPPHSTSRSPSRPDVAALRRRQVCRGAWECGRLPQHGDRQRGERGLPRRRRRRQRDQRGGRQGAVDAREALPELRPGVRCGVATRRRRWAATCRRGL